MRHLLRQATMTGFGSLLRLLRRRPGLVTRARFLPLVGDYHPRPRQGGRSFGLGRGQAGADGDVAPVQRVDGGHDRDEHGVLHPTLDASAPCRAFGWPAGASAWRSAGRYAVRPKPWLPGGADPGRCVRHEVAGRSVIGSRARLAAEKGLLFGANLLWQGTLQSEAAAGGRFVRTRRALREARYGCRAAPAWAPMSGPAPRRPSANTRRSEPRETRPPHWSRTRPEGPCVANSRGRGTNGLPTDGQAAGAEQRDPQGSHAS
jgi:hypothetical protein